MPEVYVRKYKSGLTLSELDSLWAEFRDKNPEAYFGRLNFRGGPAVSDEDYRDWTGGIQGMLMAKFPPEQHGSGVWANIYWDMEEFWRIYLYPPSAKGRHYE